MSVTGGEPHENPLTDSALGDPDAEGSRFPLVSLVAVNPHGLTFRSRCELPIGSRLELGIHVRIRSERSEASTSLRPAVSGQKNRYVPLSGYVVVSHLVNHEGRPLYEITLLFDQIDPEDAALLSQVPEADAARSQPLTSVDWSLQNLGAVKGQPRSVVGLN